MQPYGVWKDDKCWGFDAEYLPALGRLARATEDWEMLDSLSSDGVLQRVRERRHRPLARPVIAI